MKTGIALNYIKKTITLCLLCLATLTQAQIQIVGTVVSEEDSPLVGVNLILENDPSIGTSTDFDGNFSLEVTEQAKQLVVSYLGYETEVVPIKVGEKMLITLKASKSRLDEVIVTARKSSENLQIVPLSVSSFSAKALRDNRVSSINQIADYVSNVEIDIHSPFSGSSAILSPYIRGIGQGDFAINFDPGVGLYVDGVYYARSLGSVIDLLDIERIEILKGPQGTLFGRNTIGGALNVVTKNPLDGGFSVSGEVTAGNYSRVDMKLSIQLPIVEEKLAVSFAFSSRNRDGYVERIPFEGEGAYQNDLAVRGGGEFPQIGLNNDKGNQNTDTWRGKVVWKPLMDYTLTAGFDYGRVRENQSPSSLISLNDTWGPDGANLSITAVYNLCAQGVELPNNLCTEIAGAPGNISDPSGLSILNRTPYDDRFITGDPYTSYGSSDGGSIIDVWGAHVTQELKLSEQISLKSITAYRELESSFGEDQDNSPLFLNDLGFEMPQHQFTQEFQLSGNSDRLKWLTGLYYFNEEGSVTDKANLGGGLTQIFGTSESTVDNYAAFGQLTYNFTKKLSATAGFRYTTERKTMESNESDPNRYVWRLLGPNGLAGPEGIVSASAYPDPNDLTRLFPEGVFEQNFTEPTLRLGIEYKASKDVFLYSSFAQGFKSGGWTTRLTGPSLFAPEFKPEKANTYEVGMKSELVNNTIRLNLAAYYTDFRDLQISVQKGISPFLVNAAEATIVGVEFDFLWKANKNWLLSANGGWLDAGYDNVDQDSEITVDHKFANTPEVSASISSNYTIPLSLKLGRLIWHIDASTKSEIYNDAENTPELKQSGITILNTSLSYQSHDYKWQISAGITNLTDEVNLVSGFSIPAVGLKYGIHARPREFFLGVSFNF